MTATAEHARMERAHKKEAEMKTRVLKVAIPLLAAFLLVVAVINIGRAGLTTP
jgi:hypothetical protein